MDGALLRNRFLCLFPKGGLSSIFLRFFATAGPPRSSETLPAESPKNSEPIALFLKKNGFSDIQTESVLKRGTYLQSANAEKTIKPKIDVFQQFGFSSADVAYIITKDPMILSRSLSNRLYPSLSMLQDWLGSGGRVVKILRRTTKFLRTDLNKTMYPNMEYLKSLGLSGKSILRLLRLYPTTFFNTLENLRSQVERLERLGVKPSSRMFVYALPILASQSKEVWELKLQALRDIGFSESETLSIFRKAPAALTASPEKIKRVGGFLLATKRYTLSSIMTIPVCFCCSLEKRLKPRLQVLEILEERKLINKFPSLRVISSYTEKRFHRQFVAPHRAELTGMAFLR